MAVVGRAGTVKIPYHVTLGDEDVRTMAGLCSRWKDKDTGQYYYSYTVLTTKANTIMEYVPQQEADACLHKQRRMKRHG